MTPDSPVWIDLGDGSAVLKAGDRIILKADQLTLDSLPEYELEYITHPNTH